MALATFREILGDAQQNHYAVGSFNAWDLLSTKTLVETAERLSSPLIIALWKTEVEYFGEEELWWVVLNQAKKASVPIAVFIDHAQTLEDLERAIQLGATSVMIDGSRFPLEENIQFTKTAAEMAHGAGISIEGELGVLGEEDGSDPDEAYYTRAEDAEIFVEQTGIDALAVAIGNAHGIYRKAPKLDFDRLTAIRERVEVPLVLHGGTGIPDADIAKAIDIGIAKINIGADGRIAFVQGLRAGLQELKDEKLPHLIYGQAVAEHARLIESKLTTFQSVGKSQA